MKRVLWLIVGALATLLVAAPTGAHAQLAETTIAQEQQETLVATHGGWLVWSRYEAATDRWFLVARAPGSSAIDRLPVPGRAIPFDVDLGPDSRGNTVAVYSRCTRQPSGHLALTSYSHRYGRGCRIVKLDLATGREDTLYRRRGASLIYPTIWRDRLAYVVRGRSNDDLHLEQRVRRDGRISTTQLGRAPAQRTESPYAGPTRLDLYGKHLVFAWETEVNGCPGYRIDDRDYGPFIVTRVYLQHGANRRKLLDKGCDHTGRPGAIAVAHAPSISDGVVNWIRVTSTASEEDQVVLRRRSLRTGKTTQRTTASFYRSLAADGRTVYAQDSDYRIVAVRVGE